jgi:FkbM family methyltransferase
MHILEKPFQAGGVGVEIEEELWKWLSTTYKIGTIFDIGAKETTIPDIFPYAKSYLFEPMPTFYQHLINMYDGRGNVFVCPYGIGDTNESLSYYPNTESFIQRRVHVQSRDPIELPMKSFTDAWNDLGVDHVDFLKIDTEGYEYAILKNAQPYIREKKIDFIQFEMGGTIFDVDHNLFDIFALFDDSWTIYNMEAPGILTRMTSAFTWHPSNWMCSNLFATHLKLI